MSMTYKGRPFRAEDFEKDLLAQAATKIKEEMHKRYSAIRHPETGEFPTVQVLGDDLNSIRLKIEGTPALLEIVKERMSSDDQKDVTLMPVKRSSAPKAFLSFSFDDRDIAQRLAQGLMAKGIDTWWAEWEMKAGDSLRQKIDEGLSSCTHFVVLLTPNSIEKPWVKQEMDAGLVRRIAGEARFIALRYNLSTQNLPPLLSGMLSPEIDSNFDDSMRNLVNDIFEISRKPQLGLAPQTFELPVTPYSKIATAIARVFVEETTNANFGDPQKGADELAKLIGASVEDIEDALFELQDLINFTHRIVLPKPELYSTFDSYFMDWYPEKDALRIAADLINDPEMPRNTAEVAAKYGWLRRRMNPALAYLVARQLIRDSSALNSDGWLTVGVDKTDATRRFVKSRG